MGARRLCLRKGEIEEFLKYACSVISETQETILSGRVKEFSNFCREKESCASRAARHAPCSSRVCAWSFLFTENPPSQLPVRTGHRVRRGRWPETAHLRAPGTAAHLLSPVWSPAPNGARGDCNSPAMHTEETSYTFGNPSTYEDGLLGWFEDLPPTWQ